ncbi:MAG: YIP1 family protein [Candidatus Omnitrophota bacterium]
MDAVEKQPIPWQKRKELGLIKAFWQTAKQVLFKPGVFFNNLEIKSSYSEPFYFWIINVIFIAIVMIIYNILFAKGGGVGTLFIFLILSPLLIFSGVGIMHLWILLFRGKGGFKGTFNISAYSSIASIFNIIPFGVLVGGVWGTIVWVIGLKRIHKFGTLRAAVVCFFNPLTLLIIALLAAIAIPNLLRARLMANESAAQATIRTISTAIEAYAATNNGQYPSDEYDLKYGKPSYLDKIYSNKIIQGYVYSLNLYPSGYKITVTPSGCGTTGTKIFMIETKGKLSEESCK